MRFFRERRELLDTARRMSSAGLSHGTSGNLSARVEFLYNHNDSNLALFEYHRDVAAFKLRYDFK